ncbi:hypothetical protein H2202_008231 [Exophiala xenobiotica]|nr:hypothetical protein H2202_008231 [Exophiala xenobiotica]
MHLGNRFLKLLDFALSLFNAGSKIAPFTPPPGDVVILLLQASSLDLNLLTQFAIVIHLGHIVRINKSGATGFTHSMLPGTTLFHVAPSPVAAAEVGGSKVTHLAPAECQPPGINLSKDINPKLTLWSISSFGLRSQMLDAFNGMGGQLALVLGYLSDEEERKPRPLKMAVTLQLIPFIL